MYAMDQREDRNSSALQPRHAIAGKDAYLDALTELQDSDFALANGFSNHAPMVVETLFNLGAGDEIAAWMRRTAAARRPREDFDQNSTEHPRARFETVRAAVLEDLSHRPWREVLEEYATELARGHAGAALHGIIRVGHATRGLTMLDHPATRAELASALGYWSQAYSADAFGPVRPALSATTGAAVRTPQMVWQSIGLIPEEKRAEKGSIVAALKQVHLAEGFDRIDDRVTWPDDPGTATGIVADLALDLFLNSARDARTALILTHALTGLLASWTIGSQTSPELQHRLIREAFRSGAALHAAYSPVETDIREAAPRAAAASWQQLIITAKASGHDHVIKLTDACLCLERICGHERFRLAAAWGQALMG